MGQVATQFSAIAVLELSFRRWCSSNDIFVDLLTHVVDVQKCLECNPSLSQSVSKQATSILYCWTTFQQSNHDFRSLMKTSRLALGKVRKIRPPPATSGELGMIYRPHGDVSSPCYEGVGARVWSDDFLDIFGIFADRFFEVETSSCSIGKSSSNRKIHHFSDRRMMIFICFHGLNNQEPSDFRNILVFDPEPYPCSFGELYAGHCKTTHEERAHRVC